MALFTGRRIRTEWAKSTPTVDVLGPEVPFAAVAAEWQALYQEGTHPSPYLDPRWVAAFYESHPEGDRYVVRVRSEGRTVGLAPFWLGPATGRFSLRRLVQAGYSGKIETRSVTEEPLLVAASGFETQVCDEVSKMVGRLLRRGVADCAVFRAEGRFAAPKRFRGWGTVTVSRERRGSNVVIWPETWAEYRQQLGKSMRDNMAYYPKRVAKDGLSVELKIDAEPCSIEELITLHKLRAAEDPKRAFGDYFTQPCQRRNLREGILAMGEKGNAFVATLSFDGRPIAAQAFLENGRTLLASYSGFDPSYAKYSPLFILQTQVFAEAHARQVRRLDLLRGQAAWQSRWGAGSIECERHITVLSLRPGSLVRAALYATRREIVRFAERRGHRYEWLRRLGDRARLLTLSASVESHTIAARLATFSTHAHMLHAHRLVLR